MGRNVDKRSRRSARFARLINLCPRFSVVRGCRRSCLPFSVTVLAHWHFRANWYPMQRARNTKSSIIALSETVDNPSHYFCFSRCECNPEHVAYFDSRNIAGNRKCSLSCHSSYIHYFHFINDIGKLNFIFQSTKELNWNKYHLFQCVNTH